MLRRDNERFLVNSCYFDCLRKYQGGGRDERGKSKDSGAEMFKGYKGTTMETGLFGGTNKAPAPRVRPPGFLTCTFFFLSNWGLQILSCELSHVTVGLSLGLAQENNFAKYIKALNVHIVFLSLSYSSLRMYPKGIIEQVRKYKKFFPFFIILKNRISSNREYWIA